MVSSNGNGPASFVSNASIVLRSAALEWAHSQLNRGVCNVFPTRPERVKTSRVLDGPSAWRLSKYKNRPLSYVNMADENLLSRSRSAAASRPRVTLPNKERAAF